MISKVEYIILASFVITLLPSTAATAEHPPLHDKKLYSQHKLDPIHSLPPVKIVYVSKSGGANFSEIQSAIDYVPHHNQEWICIYIKAGVYREKIRIPDDKPYVYLLGEGRKRTFVVWNAHKDIETSATFFSGAENTVAKSITFQNSYNNPPTDLKTVTPAVAAYIGGDKSAFYRCRFLGFQDTLWDAKGRHYFHRCTIQGAVDFIFGAGQSIYENCTVSVLAGEIQGAGYITAQGKTSPKETNGFVFKGCVVAGTGIAYLGRPWRQYATTIFSNSNLSHVVQPEGWNSWGSQADKLTYAEDHCYGTGANMSQRVKWERNLSDDEQKRFTSMSFIDTEGWMQKQPFHMLP